MAGGVARPIDWSFAGGASSAPAAGLRSLLDSVGYGIGQGGASPTQFAGLRVFYAGAVRELSLVAAADAPSGMGGVVTINKNGVLYAVYLVETTDANASSVRIRTTTGIKAVRLKT